MPKILSYNTDRRVSNLLALSQTILEYQIEVACIQDLPRLSMVELTRIMKEIAPRHQVITAHTETTNPNEQIRTHSNCTLVHDDYAITAKYQDTENNTNLQGNKLIQLVSVEIRNEQTLGAKPTIIHNIYIRPKSTITELEATLRIIRERSKSSKAGNSNTILAGDTNATSLHWTPADEHYSISQTSNKSAYNTTKLNKGRCIDKLIKDMKLHNATNIGNGPTYTTANSSAHIDIIFIGNNLRRKLTNSINARINAHHGHKALITELRNHRGADHNGPLQTSAYVKRYKFDNINQSHVEALNINTRKLTQNWTNLKEEHITRRMNDMAEQLYTTLLEIQRSIEIRLPMRRNNTTYTHYNTAQSRTILRAVTKLRTTETRKRKLRRTATHPITKKQQNYKSAAEQARRTSLKRITNKLRMQRQKILRLLKTNTNNGKDKQQTVWEIIKESNVNNLCRMDTGDADNHNEITDEELERLANDKFPFMQRVSPQIIRAHKDIGLVKPVTLSETELDNALKSISKKKYTSPQGIKYQTFNTVAPFIKGLLLNICRMSMHTHNLPQVCNLTTGTLIPKPKAPGTFRIVHVSSPLAGLLERIALHKIEYRLEMNRLNSRQQFGFMANRGRHDLLARIIEIACKQRKSEGSKARTTLVSLDIKGAFDNINQDKLINKLIQQFNPDQICYWTAQFILSRQIEVKLGSKRSKTRNVCKGVPQGSAIGPILWNLAINQLDRKINVQDRDNQGRAYLIELLMYADDLILVYTGKQTQPLQAKLNAILQELEEIDLEISPTKCSTITIAVGAAHNANINPIKLYINGTAIETVETMCILGVNINNRLRMRTHEDPQLTNKIAANIAKLYRIRQLDIINDATQWRTLFDSLITTIIVHNSAPLMAIDSRARKWALKQLINCARTVFGWSNNVSSKLIRLICGITTPELTIERILTNKLLTEHSQSYHAILAVMKRGLQVKDNNLTRLAYKDAHNYNLHGETHSNEIGNLSKTLIHTRRRYHNPYLTLPDGPREIQLEETNNSVGPIWVMTESSSQAAIAELMGLDILQVYRAKHERYSTSYFNALSLLTLHVQNKAAHNRRWAVSKGNGLYQALTNIHNHDWRIINLREALMRNEWEIVTIPEEELKLAKFVINKTLVEHYTTATAQCTEYSNEPDTLEALISQNATRATIHPIEITQQPCLDDYKLRNNCSKDYAKRQLREYSSTHTGITRALNSDPRVWRNLTPSWLCNRSMMALSGLTQDDKGELTKGIRQRYECCENSEISDAPTDSVRDKELDSHTALHRLLYCTKLRSKRDEWIKPIKRACQTDTTTIDRRMINKTMEHKLYAQKLIRYITQAALNTAPNIGAT